MILKVCKVHGELVLAQLSAEINRHGNLVYRCRKCRAIQTNKYIHRNRELRNIYQQKYRMKHAQKARDFTRDYHRRQCDFLGDKYVCRVFQKNTKIRKKEIPLWVIDVKRAALALKRYIHGK